MRIFLFATFILLAGCQNLRSQQATPYTAAEQERRLPSLQSWRAEGKVSFKIKNQNQSASFHWDQHKGNFILHIFGPFGHSSTWIKRTSHGVTLENAELGRRQAANAEALMQTLVGWQVPVSNMQYWIKGQPAPGSKAAMTTNDLGFPSELQQQGWQVQIKQYQTVGPWQLPQKLIASRDDMRLMVVINQWQPRSGLSLF